jgi:hypothetical protein
MLLACLAAAVRVCGEGQRQLTGWWAAAAAAVEEEGEAQAARMHIEQV